MNAAPRIGSIMMIDDDEIDQMLCKRLVERSGLVETFVSYLSAEEALQHLKSAKQPCIDAILLDVNMPRMDGFEFLAEATKELGDSFARIVVLMLTTSLDPRDQERASKYSVVQGYYDKPLEIEYLERLAHLLSGNKTKTS